MRRVKNDFERFLKRQRKQGTRPCSNLTIHKRKSTFLREDGRPQNLRTCFFCVKTAYLSIPVVWTLLLYFHGCTGNNDPFGMTFRLPTSSSYSISCNSLGYPFFSKCNVAVRSAFLAIRRMSFRFLIALI